MYQTKSDLKNEQQVAGILSRQWRLRFIKLAPLHPIDYMILNPSGSLRAWAEIKVRHMKHDAFDTQWIDYFKWVELTRVADASQTPLLLLYAFNDGVFMYHRPVGETDGAVTLGGRRDRGDEYDIKPVYNIKRERFERVAGPIQKAVG